MYSSARQWWPKILSYCDLLQIFLFLSILISKYAKLFLLYDFSDFSISFPKNKEIAAKWNSFIGIDVNKSLRGRVCSDHFEDEYFLKYKAVLKLKPHAVPTLFPPALANDENVSTGITCPKQFYF